MTTTETLTETQPALTPWDRKTMRLQTRLDEIDTEITRVRAKHADKITEANNRVESVRAHITTFEHRKTDLHISNKCTYDALEAARAVVMQHERTIMSLATEIDQNDKLLAALADDLTIEERTRDITLAEPNQHLAALDADRESVAYRLQQHQARKPNTALFVGVKP